MDNATLWTTYTIIIISCFVQGHSTACSDYSSEVTGVLGENVSVSCTFQRYCEHLFWRNESSQLYIAHIGSTQTTAVKSYVDVRGDTSVLYIRQSTFDDAGFYKCFCFVSGIPTGDDICYDLQLICQIKVNVNGELMIFKGSLPSRFSLHVVNVTENDKVIIDCPDGTHLQRKCTDGTDQQSFQFTVTSSYHNCQLSCITPTSSGELASRCHDISIKLQVSSNGMSTAHPGFLLTSGESKRITILAMSFLVLTCTILV